MIHVDFVVPGSLDTRTGGYRYDKRVIEELRAAGHSVDVHEIDDSFPFPTEAAQLQADTVLSNIPDQRATIIDGLAFSVLPDVLERHSKRLHLIALIHHPLALETGLDPDSADVLRTSETRALSFARHVITTSPSTTALLDEYGVTSTLLSTVEPGTDSATLSTGGDNDTFTLLCVATITERKGHRVLVEALAQLHEKHPRRAWQCHCVGSIERDDASLASLQEQILKADLYDNIHLHGEADDATLNTHFVAADVFVLPSYHEGYGMVLTEAIAHGLPIVSTTAGAIPDTVPKDAGILVPPGDATALANALIRVMCEPTTRSQLRDGACHARKLLRPWRDTGSEFAQVCAMASTASVHVT